MTLDVTFGVSNMKWAMIWLHRHNYYPFLEKMKSLIIKDQFFNACYLLLLENVKIDKVPYSFRGAVTMLGWLD